MDGIRFASISRILPEPVIRLRLQPVNNLPRGVPAGQAPGYARNADSSAYQKLKGGCCAPMTSPLVENITEPLPTPG